MPNFQQAYPQFAKQLKQRVPIPEKEPLTSLWHWGLLVLFSLLCLTTSKGLLIILGVLIGIGALINGPGMILWGIIYSFLVSLFPPLGILLSALFFLLNIQLLTKSWRINLTAAMFYLYPIFIHLGQYFFHWHVWWQKSLVLLFGLLIIHFLLKKLYTSYPIARQVAWTVLAVPFDVFFMLLPKRLKGKIKPTATLQSTSKTYNNNFTNSLRK